MKNEPLFTEEFIRNSNVLKDKLHDFVMGQHPPTAAVALMSTSLAICKATGLDQSACEMLFKILWESLKVRNNVI